MQKRNLRIMVVVLMLFSCITAGMLAYSMNYIEDRVYAEDTSSEGLMDIVNTDDVTGILEEMKVTEEEVTEGVKDEPTTEYWYAVEQRELAEERARKMKEDTEVIEEAINEVLASDVIENDIYAEPAPQYTAPTSGLTKSGGVNYYGDQKETYYNLDMSRVVANASNAGVTGEYWVRDDGVKMYGDYVIIAANQSVHPYGSTVETSLGTGIVLDTGDFAEGNPTQVDVAVDW